MNFNKKTKIVLLIMILLALIMFADKTAQAEMSYALLEDFPGFFSANSSVDLPTFILAIYKFGIWTVGIAGLLMLTVGGFMYMTSAGNTSRVGSAKGIITDAIIGIIAALAAYLIMWVINPDLTQINISFVKVEMESVGTGTVSTSGTSTGNTTGSTTGPCTGTNAGCCKPNVSCVDCSGCAPFTNSYSRLCYNFPNCQLNTTLASKLSPAIASVSALAEVSEAWPPTMSHASLCHQNGTCADVRCKKGCRNESVANIKLIYDALKAQGLSPVFESSSCGPYTAAGIYCKYYRTMTAPSFHVNL
jgi:hypothetical protein